MSACMMSLRGIFRSGKDLSIIVVLGLVFVLGLTVKTLFELSKRKFPRAHAMGSEVRDWLRRPI